LPSITDFFVDNGPTFEDDPSPARNHLLRLTTAAFYVPFVIVSAVYVPNVIHIFMTIMVTKGLGEFIECLIPARFPFPFLTLSPNPCG
jgi:hypothetical protein